MQSYAQTVNQVNVLLDTYTYLCNQVPTDPVAVAQVNKDIIVLSARKRAIGLGSAATDSQIAINRLAAAIDALNAMIGDNAAANDILNGVASIMNQ